MRCNVVTFEARDGRRQAFPLEFLIERGAILANKVNGEDISAVMGGSNQLWVPGLPAKYFVRDIVRVSFSEEDELPELKPFLDDGTDYTNRPNVAAKGPSAGRVDEPLVFAGWAYDFDLTIQGIQFSLDEGRSWTTFETPGANCRCWVSWSFNYTPRTVGLHRMKIRAVNKRGDVSPVAAVCDFSVTA